MAVDDDFVMTIEEDDDSFKIVDEEAEMAEEPEPTPEPAKKKRKTDKKSKKAAATTPTKNDNTDSAFDPEFTFAIDGGGSSGPSHAWDFTAARDMLKEKQVCVIGHALYFNLLTWIFYQANTVARTSIDEIIAKKRQENKLKRKKGKMHKRDGYTVY